ncbi:MAG: ribonuclease III [Ilumatobacter sp.]
MNGATEASDQQQLDELCDRVGHDFADRSLLELALRHRSWCAEHGDIASNERLEFLGDAVLGWAVADLVFRRYPDEPEGALTARRINVVQEAALATIAREIDLGSCVLLGNGERQAGGADKASILSDAFEAVLAAAYLDGGAPVAFEMVERLAGPHLADLSARSAHHDHKTELQERCASLHVGPPRYELTSVGPDHAKVFTASVFVEHKLVGTGEGGSKKAAEQAAAEAARAELG